MGAALTWILVTVAVRPATPAAPRWRTLQPGVQYARIPLPARSPVGDNHLDVVRVDARRARLRVGLARRHGGRKLTARRWLHRRGLSVAINLGMFARDHRTHVGYTRVGRRLHNRRWRADYLSAVAFGPRRRGLPPAVMVDLDTPGAKRRLRLYRVVIQNLRLIKAEHHRGVNVWRPKTRKWSEAALAQDRQGRLLFLFCRSPYPLDRWNALLLRLPLGIVRAQHLEGGPEASLSISVPGLHLHRAGSYETGFHENDRNRAQWPLPNVLGVVRVPPARRRARRRRRRPRR